MKFNKISKIALLAAGLSFTISCNDDRLDLLPILDTPADEAIKTAEDLQRAVTAAYGSIGSTGAMGLNGLVYPELMSDNAFVSQTNDGYFVGVNAMNWTDASGDVSAMWGAFYVAVRSANIVIYADLPAEILNTPEAKSAIAQAKAIRGLAYFRLYQYYSPSPDQDANSPYGIVINNQPYDPGNPPLARSTAQETVTAILDDLNGALADAPDTAPNKYTFTKTTVHFLLSKVYLYIKNYPKAMEHANAVLNQAPASFYGFVSNDDYVDYFSNADNVAFQENKPETIWEIPQDVNFNFSVNAHMGAFFARTGQHRSILYRNTFKSTFETSDVRRGLFENSGLAGDDPEGVFIKKWQRTNGEGPFTQNIKVFRMTEAKFILWEAMAKSGQGAAALAAVNDYSVSRGGLANYTGDALTAVLAEKQKEFFAEGTRFYDLKRNSLPIVKATNCLSNCNIPATDKLFVMPIPFGELNLNPNMVQNPGW